MHKRICHDAAFPMAKALLDVVAPCIREEERRDAFDAFYRICLDGIEAFLIRHNRMESRLHPGKN
jgi:hypothetical protein